MSMKYKLDLLVKKNKGYLKNFGRGESRNFEGVFRRLCAKEWP
jgi:hypothetical protein